MKKHYLGLAVVAAIGTTAQAQELEEVVITGQKIERSLHDTAASVFVMTEETLRDEELGNFYELVTQAPNVYGTPNTGFSIRGIDAFNVSGGGNSYLASMYVDGAPMPYRVIQKGGFSTWDVEQVEILRGPQSTLQGRNSLAGAVIVNTRDPGYDPDLHLRAAVGEYGLKEFAAAGGSAIIDDVVAFRLSAEKNEFEGVNENITRNDHSDFNNNETYRAKLLFEPSALPGFSALLSYTHSEAEIGVLWTEQSEDGSDYDNRITLFDAPTFEKVDVDISTLELEYAFNDAWHLSSITSYSDAYYGYEWDGDASAEPISVLLDDRTDETLSQELRLVFESDAVDAVFGAYYSNLDVEDVATGQRGLTLQDTGLPTLLVAPPEYGGLGLDQATADMVLSLYAPIDPVQLGTDSTLIQEVETYALFADITWSVTDHITLFGGLRWDHEEQGNESDALYTIDNEELLPNPADYAAQPPLAALITGINAQLYQMVADASSSEPAASAEFEVVLPKAGITYVINDHINLSASYQQGYRSGGVGTNIAKATIVNYEPEYTDNYELSYRSQFLDNRLNINANLFYIDWSDQQVDVQLSGNRYDSETRNAGASTVQGFEVELDYLLLDNWQLFAGIGQAKTEFTDFTITQATATYDLSGRGFVRAPEWTGNIGTTYRQNGWFLNVNANYASSSPALTNPYISGLSEGEPGFDPQNDARTLVNAKFGYEWDKVALYVYGTNLFDVEYIQLANIGTDNVVTLGQPRAINASIEAHF